MKEITFPPQYNLCEVLFDNIDSGRGKNVAIYYENTSVTYEQLADQANKAGNVLKNLNLPPKSLVMMIMNDKPSFPALFFGGIKAGYVMAIANPNLQPHEFEHLLKKHAIKAVVTDANLYFKIKAACPAAPELEAVILLGSPEDPDTYNYEKLIQEASSDLTPALTEAKDIAFVVFSSGSTGFPKAVVHSHKDLRYVFEGNGKYLFKIQESDRVLSLSKLFFPYGFCNSICFPYSVGAATVLTPPWLTPESIFALIEKHKPTILCAVPSSYRALLNSPKAKNYDLSCIRLCVSGGETLSKSIYEEWLAMFHLEIIEFIGSSELLVNYISNVPGNTHAGSLGQAVPGIDIKIVDQDGNTVKPGEIGVMMVRGGSESPYYLDDPEKTKETMRDGWIYTNDRCHQDEDGYYYFDGRANDMFKISGQWFSPLEVERVLMQHPKVRDCIVFGEREDSGLIKIQAQIILHKKPVSEEEIRKELQKFLKLNIVPYKLPHTILFVDEIPKTSTGKKRRPSLR